MILARWIKHPIDVTIERLHDPDPREHRRTAESRIRVFHCGLPFRRHVLALRKPLCGHDHRPNLRLASIFDWQVFLLRGADHQLYGYEMRSSKKVRKSKPYRRLISEETLRRKMSEVISLRERVAQAELDVGGARLRQIGRAGIR
jgi:hypothetical protein